MNAVVTLAAKELRDGLRNRWIAAAILVLTALKIRVGLSIVLLAFLVSAWFLGFIPVD